MDLRTVLTTDTVNLHLKGTTKEEIIHDLTVENNGDISNSQQTDINEGVSKENNIVNDNNKKENNQIEPGKIGEKLRNIRKGGMKKICKC
jgi:hypothetical protein